MSSRNQPTSVTLASLSKRKANWTGVGKLAMPATSIVAVSQAPSVLRRRPPSEEASSSKVCPPSTDRSTEAMSKPVSAWR